MAPAVQPLTERDEAEALEFLALRPLHTFGLAGFLKGYGAVSAHNRGVFYGYRDGQGQLTGVALVGHFTMIEVRSEDALRGIALVAQRCPTLYLILGEETLIRGFWNHFAPCGRTPVSARRKMLLVQKQPLEVKEALPGLRPATLGDIECVVAAHGLMTLDEHGLLAKRMLNSGFVDRCVTRIRRGHTWLLRDREDRLVFKAEVVADTPEVIYLEGIWVHPDTRGQGYGLRCLAQLGRELLRRTKAICLLVKEQDRRARAFYEKAGYEFVGHYQALFMQ